MKLIPITLILAGLGSPALADAAPFDMTPERGDAAAAPQPPGGVQSPLIPAAVPQAGAGMKRYLLQEPVLRLQGEQALKRWSFTLTPEQAASETTLEIGYSNAVMVAPEASRLSVLINDVPVLDQQPKGNQAEQHVSLKLPAGVLRSGVNTIRMEADQRHRTDCTVDSTYALWTDIDARATFLSFTAPSAAHMVRLDDIRAMSPGPDGRSRFVIVAPSLGSDEAAATLLKLAQGLSLLSEAPNLSFSFSRTLPSQMQPGDVVVVVATTAEAATLAGIDAQPQRSRMLAGFDRLPGRQDKSALMFLGMGWADIGAMVDNFLTVSVRGGAPVAKAPGTGVPMVNGSSSYSFDQLGVQAQEFSGRRFSTEFKIAIPADFYAGYYGTASILLDAAYSSRVLPGSSLNVTVNGNLATTVPITVRGGAVLRHDPIRVTMRHFEPGVNTIGIEALLMTANDLACAPGASADRTPRFAIFESSELVVPEFARLALGPNREAMTGIGAPYEGVTEPTAIMLARNDEATLSAAATTVGKLASTLGRNFPIRIETTISGLARANSLVFGVGSALPPDVLGPLTFSTHPVGETTWNQSGITVDSWRDKVDSGTISEFFSGINTWMKNTFNLDFTTVDLRTGEAQAFHFPDNAGIFISQSVNATSKSVQTLIGASDDARLLSGAQALGDQSVWSSVGGRLSYLDTQDMTVTSLPPSGRVILQAPSGLANLRLILTNWLSGNYVFYALGFVLSAIALGLTTHWLMRRLGRNET